MGLITFQCYTCTRQLRVDGDKAGKKTRCPNCGTILTIPASIDPEEIVEVAAGDPPFATREADYEPRPRGRRSPDDEFPALSRWSIFLLSGAAVLLVSAFLPWWGISVKLWTPEEWRLKPLVDQKEYATNAKESLRIYKENLDWYRDHLSSRDQTRLRIVLIGRLDEIDPEREHKFSKTLLGIHTTSGILGLVFGFMVIVPVIVGIFLTLLRPWLWIASFISAIFGSVLVILALIWVFGSPGESASDVLRQGKIIGPWLALLGALTVLTAGVLDGIYGVLKFIRRLRPSGRPN